VRDDLIKGCTVQTDGVASIKSGEHGRNVGSAPVQGIEGTGVEAEYCSLHRNGTWAQYSKSSQSAFLWEKAGVIEVEVEYNLS